MNDGRWEHEGCPERHITDRERVRCQFPVMKVYLWQNDMLMVFGWDGEQIAELQGRKTKKLINAIRKLSSEATTWNGFGADGPCEWNPK